MEYFPRHDLYAKITELINSSGTAGWSKRKGRIIGGTNVVAILSGNMKTRKLQSQQIVTPDIGPKNWVIGRSLGYLGTTQYAGEPSAIYLQAKGKQGNDRSFKNKKEYKK